MSYTTSRDTSVSARLSQHSSTNGNIARGAFNVGANVEYGTSGASLSNYIVHQDDEALVQDCYDDGVDYMKGLTPKVPPPPPPTGILSEDE